nr:gypsy/Ty3 retroelement polyprotein [Tanacetum cinerariifolium]
GIGAVLQQRGHPLAYYSKKLAPRHYTLSTYEKELLAVIHALSKWKGYLLDRDFKIMTNHFSLKYLLKQRIATPSQMKWLPKLMGFDYEILYKQDPSGGHSGVQATLKRITCICYWRKLRQQVKAFVAICKEISMDFIKGLPSSHGKSAIFVVVDRLNRTLAARESMIQLLQFYLERAQQRMKDVVDAKRSDRDFDIGQWVYLMLQPHR